MYGTIARIHPKPGSTAAIAGLFDEWNRERRPRVAGARESFLFTPDRNPYERPTQFLVAIFEDEASYRANADNPEQDAWYRRFRDRLVDDPDWSDGTFQAV